MTIALIITQFVGIPFSFGFGRLAQQVGAKSSILIGLGVYVIISIAGFFMQTASHFYILTFMVGMVQGGTQALSRSLYGAMIPKSQSAEFFGFFSTSSKFAGIVGPFLFGVVSQLAGGSRLSIVALVIFFTSRRLSAHPRGRTRGFTRGQARGCGLLDAGRLVRGFKDLLSIGRTLGDYSRNSLCLAFG